MTKHRKKTKPRAKTKKIVAAPGEVVSVIVPPEHTPVISTHLRDRMVEIVPVKKKKGWWETLLYGDDE